jgi:hypothetical protein
VGSVIPVYKNDIDLINPERFLHWPIDAIKESTVVVCAPGTGSPKRQVADTAWSMVAPLEAGVLARDASGELLKHAAANGARALRQSCR